MTKPPPEDPKLVSIVTLDRGSHNPYDQELELMSQYPFFHWFTGFVMCAFLVVGFVFGVLFGIAL